MHASVLPDTITREAHHTWDGFTSFVPGPRVLSADELRELDHAAEHELGIPPAVLMENAALHAARLVASIEPGPVLILCGSGNNGGDGYALARQLATAGLDAKAIAVSDPAKLTGPAAMNHAAADRLGLVLQPAGQSDSTTHAIEQITSGRWHTIADAILGTGLSRPVEGQLAERINALNTARRKGTVRQIVALDIPSGLHADTGEPLGVATKADLTITFAASKQGFGEITAQPCLGEIALVPIGVPDTLVSRFGEPLTQHASARWRDAHQAHTPPTGRPEPPAAGRNASP